jgi:ssDNA-binding Zn-finger/Zn-ribbon topoisomerase 1
MVELADIFLRHGPEYLDRFANRMLPSHIRAMQDIVKCRTPAMGGRVYQCQNPECHKHFYSYHSCGNRSCPKCGQDRTEQWLEKQNKLLLPTHYFLVTFTLPAELRNIARSNQKLIYNLLFTSSAAALQKLAKDTRFLGGTIGMIAGLHTWRRDMQYHPHVHYIVPGGGLSPDSSQWKPSNPNFFVRVEPLSLIFRAKFKEALKKTALYQNVSHHAWGKDWVVHSKPVGDAHRALKYLAPYVYRVAITNNRIENLENGSVVFRFKNSDTKQWETRSVSVMEFIRRFLQHVLPKGFVKIRYYGLFAPGKRNLLAVAKYLLGYLSEPTESVKQWKNEICPHCGHKLLLIKTFPRLPRPPP